MSGPLRVLLIGIGTLSVALGVAGIVLPLVPTTPFLLLSAWCFGRSSTRLHRWLLRHPWFGQYLRDVQSGHGMPARAKVVTLVVLWATIGWSAAVLAVPAWVRLLLLAVAAGVTLFLLRLPTRRAPREEDEETPA